MATYTFNLQGAEDLTFMLRDYQRRIQSLERKIAANASTQNASSQYVKLLDDISAADHSQAPIVVSKGFAYKVYSIDDGLGDSTYNLKAYDETTKQENPRIEVYNYSETAFSANQIVLATRNRGEGKYVILGEGRCVSSVRPFTLTATLATGSASVDWDDCPGEVGTVWDRNAKYAHGCPTDSGYAAFIQCVERYEIITFDRCNDGVPCV